MARSNYQIPRLHSKNVLPKLPSRVEHSPEAFGFLSIDGDGSGVRICIIDTGFPHHPEIAVPMTNIVNFTQSAECQDRHGHGSGVAGIIKARGPNLVGLSPMADVFFAKALSDKGLGEHGSVQAAVLYAVVKRADIIVMSFGSESSHPVLKEAIRKAYERGSVIFAASGVTHGSSAKDAQYPARFPEVMSVGLGPARVSKDIAGAFNIDFPVKTIETLYLDGQFTHMSGTSIVPPIAAGIAARIIQRRRAQGQDVAPAAIYQHMMNGFDRP